MYDLQPMSELRLIKRSLGSMLSVVVSDLDDNQKFEVGGNPQILPCLHVGNENPALLYENASHARFFRQNKYTDIIKSSQASTF